MNISISALIRDRILLKRSKVRGKKAKAATRFFANDNISEFIQEGELEQLQAEVETKVGDLLNTLVIDTENDHNTKDTARRVAKMLIQETMYGRYQPIPRVTEFPDVSDLDQIQIVGPITIHSMCSHHLQNIEGVAYCGMLANKQVIGMSKFHRVADWIMRRPQIQEEATTMLADAIENEAKPKGIGVLIMAHHSCCGVRGVKDPRSMMTTSVMRGIFRDPTVKEEFLRLVEMSRPLRG